MKTAEKVKIGLFLFSLLLLYMAYYQYNVSTKLLRDGHHTKATVVEMITVYDSDGSDTFKPRFEYRDMEGDIVTYTSNVSSSPPSYHVGQKVEIVYDARHFKVNSFWGLYRWSVFLSIFAAPFFIIGMFHFLKNRGRLTSLSDNKRSTLFDDDIRNKRKSRRDRSTKNERDGRYRK